MLIVENKDKFLLVVFIVMVSITGIDLYTDLSHGTSVEHVMTEAIVLCLALTGVLWLLWGIRRQQKEIATLRDELLLAKQSDGLPENKQPDAYVLDARRKLADVIHQQFTDWGLSKSEQDVGWLLLKGLSLKEIAMLRNTLEKTVRQQASAIYRKAGISGRHAFAAWFIEDML